MPIQYIQANEALSSLKSHQRVFIQGIGAFPQALVDAMVSRSSELKNVEIVHLHVDGKPTYADPIYQESFRVNNLFVGSNMRAAVQSGNADYTPIFLSEVPLLFRRGILPLDLALVHVSPPDQHGFCSLGVSVDVSVAAIETAKTVIAQVNPCMPRTHGDGAIHYSKFTHMVWHEAPLPTIHAEAPNDIELAIGKHVAELVEDGATLQMGIGSIPNAVLLALGNHKGLGIHTEMFSDGLIPLIEKGVVTGEHKVTHKGKIVSGFAMGSQNLYDYINDNPLFRFLDIAYVNDTVNIRRNPKVTAINSAIEIDLTGQVCADSIGTKIFSGVGGQMDFIRGATLSQGGKPIIALPSITSKGESRITAFLKQGAGVVTTRAHMHYVATEYGVADLYGKSIRQRAKQLIEIAHPSHREHLERAAFEQWKLQGPAQGNCET
jgi:4-hydroxybutyrate CoA-transferase